MIQQSEMILLLLGVAVLIYIIRIRHQIKRIPAWQTLSWAYFVLIVGWLLTILEGFFWKDFLNLLEHACYAGCSVLMAVWCWAVFCNRKEAK